MIDKIQETESSLNESFGQQKYEKRMKPFGFILFVYENLRATYLTAKKRKL